MLPREVTKTDAIRVDCGSKESSLDSRQEWKHASADMGVMVGQGCSVPLFGRRLRVLLG